MLFTSQFVLVSIVANLIAKAIEGNINLASIFPIFPIKERASQPKCSNCGGDHVASDPECAVFKKAVEKRSRNSQIHVEQRARRNNGDFKTGLPRGSVNHNNNNQRSYRDAVENAEPANESADFNILNTIGEIKDLFQNINIVSVFNTIKSTMCKLRSAQDGISKAAIIIEGIFELFT